MLSRQSPILALFLLLATFLLLARPASAIPPKDRPTSDRKYVNPHPPPVEPTTHVKCSTTGDLLECRDRCHTTFGPYSDFYSDCQECCRKICRPTAFCDSGITYWRTQS